jgi:predicted kinase
MHINPDHFLETAEGRVTTPERNQWAWRECHAALANSLASAGTGAVLYVLVGAQGSGKSTWARERIARESGCVIFDAILVKRSERAPLLAQAALHRVPAVAVWFRVPLQVCVDRNAARPADEVADEQGLRNVFAALEPPTVEEGFAQILLVEHAPA